MRFVTSIRHFNVAQGDTVGCLLCHVVNTSFTEGLADLLLVHRSFSERAREREREGVMIWTHLLRTNTRGLATDNL